MVICRAHKSDAEAIALIGISVWIDTYLIDGVDEVITSYIQEEFNASNIEHLIEQHNVYMINNEGCAIGYVVVTDHEDKSEIENFYILPQFQRSGLGRKLLSHLRDNHKNLWLRCWHKNEKALRFYYANGFAKTGETYFELGGESHKNEVLSDIRENARN